MTVTAEQLERHVKQIDCARKESITRQSFSEMVHRYIYAPIIRAGGTPPKQITVREAWSLMIARRVRERKGESLETAMRVCEILRSYENTETCPKFRDSAGRVSTSWLVGSRRCCSQRSLLPSRNCKKSEKWAKPRRSILRAS